MVSSYSSQCLEWRFEPVAWVLGGENVTESVSGWMTLQHAGGGRLWESPFHSERGNRLASLRIALGGCPICRLDYVLGKFVVVWLTTAVVCLTFTGLYIPGAVVLSHFWESVCEWTACYSVLLYCKIFIQKICWCLARRGGSIRLHTWKVSTCIVFI